MNNENIFNQSAGVAALQDRKAIRLKKWITVSYGYGAALCLPVIWTVQFIIELILLLFQAICLTLPLFLIVCACYSISDFFKVPADEELQVWWGD